MKLQDFQVSRCTSHVHVPFAATWSQDNIVAMATNVGVYLMEMTPSPFSRSPTLDIHRYIVFPSDDNPTSDSGIDLENLMHNLKEETLYQIVQDSTLAPQIKGSRYSPTVKHAAWSPMNLTHNKRSILTVLTDSGGLDLYCLMNTSWKHVFSISNQWHSLCKSDWNSDVDQVIPSLELLKERTYKIKITAFSWGEVHAAQETWCPLFAVTMNGTILLWKIREDSSKIISELISEVPTKLGQVTAINSQLVNQSHYLLFCASITGRLQTFVAYLINSTESIAVVDQTNDTWPEEDRIQVPIGGMVSANWPNKVVLAVAKGPHLLLLLFSSQGTVISNCVLNSNDLSITGICFVTSNNLLMTTTEGTVHIVTIRVDYNGFLQTEFSMVQSNIQFENYRCNGFAISNSKAIMCLIFSVQGTFDHLQLRECSQAVWCTLKVPEDAFSTVNNHLGSLYDIWDIFELLRIQCLKKNWSGKILTVHNIEELDVMDVCKLKKNLWFVEISLKLDSHSSDTRKFLETLRDEMTTLIMSSHIFKRVTQLTSSSEDKITELNRESLSIMRHWLYYLVNSRLKPSYTVTHASASTLLQQIDESINEGEYSEKCSICADHVEGIEDITTSQCVQGHVVPRCFLSMVQCGMVPYYTCPVCKVVAHPSAVRIATSTCIFCDYYLRIDEKIISKEEYHNVN